MKTTNLDFLFQNLVLNFAHLITKEKQTKQQFADKVKQVYSIENPKTMLFYESVLKSDFETIRLSSNKQSILFNQ